MEILYTEKAAKELRKIAGNNKKNAELIIKKIESYVKNPKGLYDIKLLKGKFASFKRLRAGDYRIIFDEENNVMYIYEIKSRKEAYK